MTIINRLVWRPFSPRGANIILPQHLQHRRSRQTHDQSRGAKTDRSGGDAEQQKLVPKTFWRIRIDRDGTEIGDEAHQDKEPEPERRHRQAAQADYPQHVVKCRVLSYGADYAERHAEYHRKTERQCRELCGDGNSRSALLECRFFGDVGIAETPCASSLIHCAYCT